MKLLARLEKLEAETKPRSPWASDAEYEAFVKSVTDDELQAIVDALEQQAKQAEKSETASRSSDRAREMSDAEFWTILYEPINDMRRDKTEAQHANH